MSDVIVVVIECVAFIALSASGHQEAAITVLVTVTALELLGAMRRRRLPSRRDLAPNTETQAGTYRIQEAIRLWHSPETVWDVICAAENAPLLSPEVTRAYRVPGTPSGLGEQQAFIDTSGNTSVIEVIDYAHCRLAVTRNISPRQPVSVRTFHAVEPVGDGCLLTLGQEYDGHILTPEGVEHWRTYATGYLERVRTTLATWQSQDDKEPAT
ncbi:MAG: SRPBCC family protein [Jatrophihabitantaceae bacterium]